MTKKAYKAQQSKRATTDQFCKVITNSKNKRSFFHSLTTIIKFKLVKTLSLQIFLWKNLNILYNKFAQKCTKIGNVTKKYTQIL